MRAFIAARYSQHKQVVQGFAWRLIQMAGKQGVTFVIFILCAKLLNPYDFGIYNYILNFIFFLVMFGDFGISTAASKYIAEYNLTDIDKRRAVLFNAASIIGVAALFISVISIAFSRHFLQEKTVYLFYLLPLLLLAPLTSLYDGLYRGMKRFRYLALASSLTGVFSLSTAYFFVSVWGLKGALLFQDIAYALLLLALVIGYKDFDVKINKSVLKEVGSYSLIYGLAVAGNYFFIRFGILILGHYGYIQEIATYELLNKIFLVLVIPFTMLGQVVAPNFTEMAVYRQYEKIFTKVKNYTAVFSVSGIVIGVAVYALMPVLIRLFFPAYNNEIFFRILPFSVLILVTNIWAATVDAGIAIPTGFAYLMAEFYIILGIVSAIVAYLLTSRIGYMGTVYSFAGANLIMFIGFRLLLLKKIQSLKNSLILR